MDTSLKLDDNSPRLYAKSKILRRTGYDTIEASSGENEQRLFLHRLAQIVIGTAFEAARFIEVRGCQCGDVQWGRRGYSGPA